MTIRVRIPDDVAPGSLHRRGTVVKVIAAMREVGSLLRGDGGGGLERVDYAIVQLDSGVIIRVRFDDCELLSY